MFIKMRSKKYKIDTKKCEYEVSITSKNVLVLKRGQLIFLEIHLDNLCLGSKLEILKFFNIEIEDVTDKDIKN